MSSRTVNEVDFNTELRNSHYHWERNIPKHFSSFGDFLHLTYPYLVYPLTAPTGLQAPIQLIPLPGGTEVRVTWAPPARPNGVLTEYRILSYRVHPRQAVPAEKVVSDIGVLNTTVSGLQPYTIYEIKIQAFTAGGSSVGPGKNVTTEESGILNIWL